jgi:hypothetical protein
MIKIQTIGQILAEQRAFDYQKVITDAIKNRRKISFYYNGPTRPRKDSVKPGRRILVEPTALGLTEKGNLAVKGYVKPPSVTKTGFEKHNWRTFLLNRIHRLELTDDVFNQPQPGFKAGDDGSFTKTYASVDFGRKSRINKYDQPVYTKLGRKPVNKTAKPELEPTEPEMGAIKPEVEPTEPELTPQMEPINPRVEPEFEPETGTEELPEPKSKEKPPVNPDTQVHPEDEDDTDRFLQEQIKHMKSLILKIKKL